MTSVLQFDILATSAPSLQAFGKTEVDKRKNNPGDAQMDPPLLKQL